MADPDQNVDRQSSWIRDMIAQAGEAGAADVQELLRAQGIPTDAAGPISGAASASSGSGVSSGVGDGSGSGVPNDDEVLEQYRIMALFQAKQLLLKNTGRDYIAPPDTDPPDLFPIKRPKPERPDLSSVITSESSHGGSLLGGGMQQSEQSSVQYEDLKLPPPRYNRKYLEKRAPIQPEHRDGIRVDDPSMPLAKTDTVFRCLRCGTYMLVKERCDLVSCPECTTVNPVWFDN